MDKLQKLQELEDEIEQNRKDKDRLYLDVGQQRDKVEELKEEREEAKAERQRCLKEADQREVHIKAAEDENEKIEVQRNTTKDNAQFQAMGRKIRSNLADIEKWETEELELLDRADKMKKKMAKLDEKIEEARAELKEIKKRVEETARDYEETIKDLEAKRKAMRDDIAPKVLKDYERIARNRGSSALVKAKKRVCQGCFTTLTKQTENELLKGEEIVHCQNCGRMLTLNKEDSTW